MTLDADHHPASWKFVCVPTVTLCLCEKPAVVSRTYRESLLGTYPGQLLCDRHGSKLGAM
jgi:hypothetical protein